MVIGPGMVLMVFRNFFLGGSKTSVSGDATTSPSVGRIPRLSSSRWIRDLT
jgi:hypothetical protein